MKLRAKSIPWMVALCVSLVQIGCKARQSDERTEVEGDTPVDDAAELQLASPTMTTRLQMYAQGQAIVSQMHNFTNSVNNVTASFPKATTIKSLATEVNNTQVVMTAYLDEFTQQQNDATISRDFGTVAVSLTNFHNLYSTCSNILKSTKAPTSLSPKRLTYSLIEPYKTFLATGLAVDVAVKNYLTLKVQGANSSFQRNISYAQLKVAIQSFNDYIATVEPYQTSNPSFYQLGQTIQYQVIGTSQSLLSSYTNQDDDSTVVRNLDASVQSGGIHTFRSIYAQYAAILGKQGTKEPFKTFLLSLNAANTAVKAVVATDNPQ